MPLKLESPIIAKDLLNFSGLKHVSGSLSAKALLISTAESPMADSLIFVSTQGDLLAAIQANAGILIASAKLALSHSETGPAVFSVPSIPHAMVEILSLAETRHRRIQKGIATSAAIHPTARVGTNVQIGEYVVIGAGATIGDNVTLSHHVVVEEGAKIGANSFLHPQVVIGAKCILGNFVEIQSHSVIGSDGFGYATMTDKTHKKIPQVGIVVLEDHVELGAHCAIDRATLDETRICSGTKIDNLVHIAHNCKVGPNSRITAGFFMAGSSSIGANFLTGGMSALADHVHVTDDVMLGGRSSVTKDITTPGAYAGYPLEPLKDSMKNTANLTHLTRFRRELAEVRKHLGLTDKKK
jgi:UDP-3-O-[3-hydroxymyristoyl] glucosamine N-acyltransferase